MFRLSVVLGGEARSKVEVFVKNPESEGAVPGGEGEQVLVIHVLGGKTQIKSTTTWKTGSVAHFDPTDLEGWVVVIAGGRRRRGAIFRAA